jgi:hypothetical protein
MVRGRERLWDRGWISTHAEVALPLSPLHGAVAGVFGRVEVSGKAAARVHDDLAVLGCCAVEP